MGKKEKKKDKKRSRDDSVNSTDSDTARASKRPKERGKDKKRSKEEKERLKEAKKFLKQKLKQDRHSEDVYLDSDAKVDEISSDAYFEKNPEFTAWLKEEKGLYFNDLPTTEARNLFEEFVLQWNARKLKRKLYAGMTPADARRSQHRWGIQGGRSVDEVKLGIAAAAEEERELRETAQEAEKAERRRWKADQSLLLDEMLPKATGREAHLEKRIARREETRARETSPEVTRLPGGGDIYGGGDDSFAAAKSRESNRDAWKEKQRSQKSELASARLREAQAKEDERMAQFRALAAMGPIQIAKRH